MNYKGGYLHHSRVGPEVVQIHKTSQSSLLEHRLCYGNQKGLNEKS